MSVQASDVKFRKSEFVTDTSANGGRKGQVQVVSGARHNLFPRVSKAERIAGITRYRKEFWCNENPDDDVAFDLMVFLEFPSNGGDRFAIGKGSQVDIQGDIIALPPDWFGVGKLEIALSGGEVQVDLAMEGNDFVFPNDGYLHLTNKFETGQTVDADVGIGDSVEFSAGTWSKIAATDNIIYPKGLYVGSNVVMTAKDTIHEEWPKLKNYLYENEDIGDGDGANTTPVLVTLAHKTNGVCAQTDKLPIVKATCGGVERTVDIAADGSCSGYCSAGQLNMTDGTWTANITWTTAPDNLTDITITYRENCFKYTGNVATVYLEDQVANAYTTAKSYGAGCIQIAEVKPLFSNWTEVSVAGTYDEAGYPLILFNDGTERDSWTITFTSPTAFTCSGAKEGNVGTGSVSADFSPINPNTGQPYFTVDKDGWGGTWAIGETITFITDPSVFPIWWKQIVPPVTAVENDNLTVLGFYCE
jgi:hypothetical protein